MSTTVDNRVVSMQFDNSHFEKNVGTTLSTLDKLKQKLNLDGAARGLDGIRTAASNINFSGLANAVETVQARFSVLNGIAMGALMNIGSTAVNVGTKMIKALTIDPITTGFQEYETQINAVQTILANTQSKGTTLNDVTGALDVLNTYADQTIYNFTEMTRNIGTFTAAGVDLDKSVTSIKGIANLAAVSGSTSQQASTAMYQLSQALAAGKVSLMDWNSVVNAGMGGQVFQEALKRTARQQGHDVDALIEKYGSFRESLTQGNWLTVDVLTETLTQLSGAYTEADLIAQGYTAEQAKQITELAKTASDAATKVKTFTQLWDTLKESAQSGWTQTWEIIVGDFEEAKDLLTKISDVVGGYIGRSAEARNKVLEDWKSVRYDEFGNIAGQGGRAVLIDALTNAFKGLLSVITPIGEAIKEVFDPITGNQLYDLTVAFEKFTSKMTVSEETADKIKRTFKGVFSIVELFGKALKIVFGLISPVLSIVGSLLNIVLSFTAVLGDMFTAINEGAGTGNFFSGIADGITGAFQFVADILNSAAGAVGNLGDAFSGIGEIISGVAGKIGEVIGAITDNISAGDIFAGLAGGGLFVLFKNLSGLISSFKDLMGGGLMGLLFGGGDDNPKEKAAGFGEVLDSVKESLSAFTSGIKIASLATIAIAIGVLSASLRTISELDAGDIAKSLGAIAAMLVMLNISFSSLSKTLSIFQPVGVIKAGISLIFIAAAMNVLADAIVTIADVPFDDVIKGLFAIGVGLATLSVTLKFISGFDSSLKSAATMVVLAYACKMLGDALAKFTGMSWGEIARGLTAMGGALAELTIVLGVMGKVGGLGSLAGSASLLIAVQALDEIAEALKNVGMLSWEQIAKGLAGIGGALGEITLTVGLLGKFTSMSSVVGAAAILMVAESLGDIGAALKDMGSMAWGEIARGLTAMGGALAELAITVGVLGKITGLSGIGGATAILVAAQSLGDISEALKNIGSLSWEQIARGLVGMGGALTELAVITGVLGSVAGLPSLLGGGSLLLSVQSLGDLADAFKKFGEMTWEQIAIGMVGMGGALTELSVITSVLGSVAGLPALLGGGAILLAVQGLGDLADAFKKFGEMSWDEVKNGLVAMGAALGEIALGGILNTFSGFGAGAIAEMAEPLGVLADSVKRWTKVTVPEGLGEQLGILADGVKAFTFGGWGAGALAEAAEPLGVLADSVRKWTGVVIPEGMQEKLLALSNGVKSFTFGGFGAGALAEAAEPLGVLADSVKKWAGVVVPEGIQAKLEELSNGIKAWTWAFAGGWSIGAVCEPLKSLADSVKAWNSVNIPEGMKEKLEGLAGGIEAWSWAFVGGWSIGSICEPLKNLASSIKAWNGVSLQIGLGDNLQALAKGVDAISDVSVGDLTGVCDGIRDIGTAVSDISSVDFGSVTSKLSGFAEALGDIKISSDTFTNLGQTMVNGISKAIAKASTTAQNSGKAVVQAFAEGINKTKSLPTTYVTAMVKSAAKAATASMNSFTLAGYNCAIGFANGISSGSFAATARARAMANAAARAAKKELDEHSPSKVFYKIGAFAGLGFTNALSDYADKSYTAGSEMASSARSGLGNAIGKLADLVDTDMDTQPTIRPVLDLSDVESGAGLISNMFGMTPSVSVLGNVNSINTSMNRRIQNGANSEVVSAIDKLRKDVGNLENKSYSIGGISYSSGDEVSNAIETLVRAVRVEGRV